ncbi:MAG: hypothetical protein GX878_01070, partial [Firmicutes bacterium]|nr:hypothetical protein [Bacillota bacterium]
MFPSIYKGKGKEKGKEALSRAGRIRKDRSTKKLVQRLRSKEIALISHCGLDWTAAEGLLRCGVRTVLNTEPFCSDLFPPAALQQLLRRKVHLVENLGEEFFEAVRQGEMVRVVGAAVYCRGMEIGRGNLLTEGLYSEFYRDSLQRRDEVVENFLVNTLDYAYRERALVTGKIHPPPLKSDFKNRHVVVVIRGKGFREDLRAMKYYLREKKPLLIGVDGGGDAILEFGLRPDLIIGDMDSVS